MASMPRSSVKAAIHAVALVLHKLRNDSVQVLLVFYNQYSHNFFSLSDFEISLHGKIKNNINDFLKIYCYYFSIKQRAKSIYSSRKSVKEIKKYE